MLGGLNDDDLEDAILIGLGEPRESGYLRSSKYSRIDLNTFTDVEFHQKFRFKRESFEDMCHGLGIPGKIQLRNRYSTTGIEGLAILLRKMVYPNRWCDLESLFGLSSSHMSVISSHVMQIIIEKKDGTCRAICRPSINQEDFYSGHKRMHCLKYLDILCPDGMIVCLVGTFRGRRHASGILIESHLYEDLKRMSTYRDKKCCIYGDSGFPLKEFLLTPFPNVNLDRNQILFNKHMSSVRQAVEWGFGKVINEFAFLDFKKNQKLMHQEVSKMYNTAVILTNCHTCLYGNQTADYFNVQPPSLSQYLM
ncbi:hypothetical protein JTE90_003362 [Oedothorax gibbosus]|uniref:DDE Tnp4 domain-containing protein n=1 Tax=Oedothorax gibbosus TaxID=931172 RepID=A0AAV6TZE2_9ARAC|nr:hypothetical protein JTE90_003362 [Oedothorax gibbosus]